MKYADQRAEITRLTGALERIRSESGKVCDQFEICTHLACQSSYAAWAIADSALKGKTPEEENAEALRRLYGEC